MAADPDSTGIIGNAIAAVVAIGGAVMVAFASVRALLGAGRDAREALSMSKANDKVLDEHNARFATVEANAKAARDVLDKIERSVEELLRRTPRR